MQKVHFLNNLKNWNLTNGFQAVSRDTYKLSIIYMFIILDNVISVLKYNLPIIPKKYLIFYKWFHSPLLPLTHLI